MCQEEAENKQKMTNTQTWTYGFIFYFTFLFIIVTLFSIAGVFANNHDVVINDEFTSSFGLNTINQTRWVDGDTDSTATVGSYSITTTFKDLFSFFYFNISIYNHGIMQYLWLIRLIFVGLPMLGLVLTIYYSLPTVSGS